MTERNTLEDVMYGRRRAPLIEALLVPLAWLYAFGLLCRKLLYAVRIIKRKRLPCSVISVGNITLGGTGKTPAVIQIARLLLKHKKYPAVVSRGYGRRNESELVVVSDGKVPLRDTAIGGDEPSLIGYKVPGVPVIAGKNRYEAALFAIQVFGSNSIILDDGFQHIRLSRDLDIVLIDAEDPFGNGSLFPRGILREPLSSLQRARLVLITRADRAANIELLKSEIRSVTKARIFTSRHRPVDLIDTKSGETRSLSTLRGTAALAFSGIARPGTFLDMLRSIGADIRLAINYPDHHAYTKEDMAIFFQKAVDLNATMLITTEKDAARLQTLNPDGVWALRIELKIDQEDEWEKEIVGKEQQERLR